MSKAGSQQKRKERTAGKKAEQNLRTAALQKEKTLSAAYPDAHLPPPPVARVITEEWILASVYPAHTGRHVIDDLPKIWDVNWGRCDKRFLEGKLHTCPLRNIDFLGPVSQPRSEPDHDLIDRFPFLFANLSATQKGFGLVWPEDLDLDMVVTDLGEKYPGNVVNNFSLERKVCEVGLWRTYVKTGKPPAGFVPKPPLTAHHSIFNMSGLEISNTPLADRIELPFMQRQCDPVVRFADHLGEYDSVQGSLYVLSTKAGSFTGFHIDATAEVHWLTVVDGEKWVFLLPPPKHNVDKYLEGEDGAIRGDTEWLADLCAKSPACRVILKPGMTLLIPSRYIHAIWTPVDSLALAGGWVDEYNAPSQTKWRETEFEKKTRKDNRFPNYERICWLMAEEWMNKWKSKTARVPTKDFLDRMKHLLDFVTEQAKRIEGMVKGRSARAASAFLPKGWRETNRHITVANGLRRGFLDVLQRLKASMEDDRPVVEDGGRPRDGERPRGQEGKSEQGVRVAGVVKTASQRRPAVVKAKLPASAKGQSVKASVKETTRAETRARSLSPPVRSTKRQVLNSTGTRAEEQDKAKESARAKKPIVAKVSARTKEGPKAKELMTVKGSTMPKQPVKARQPAKAKVPTEAKGKAKEPLKVTPGWEQARMEAVRLGKRKEVEGETTSSNKRQRERSESVVWLGGHHDGNWDD